MIDQTMFLTVVVVAILVGVMWKSYQRRKMWEAYYKRPKGGVRVTPDGKSSKEEEAEQ